MDIGKIAEGSGLAEGTIRVSYEGMYAAARMQRRAAYVSRAEKLQAPALNKAARCARGGADADALWGAVVTADLDKREGVRRFVTGDASRSDGDARGERARSGRRRSRSAREAAARAMLFLRFSYRFFRASAWGLSQTRGARRRGRGRDRLLMRAPSPRARTAARAFREACGALASVARDARLKSADAALAASDTSMKKCLTAADLILLGAGGHIGGGVFVAGAAAHDHAGAAVVVSYVLAR